MKFLKHLALTIAILFSILAGPAFAQTTPVPQSPEVGATCDHGGSLQSFKDAAAKSKEHVLIMQGKDLEAFANAIDAIIQPGEHHDPAITALAFVDPSTAKEGQDTTQVAIFKNDCLTGVIPLPTEVVKKALGQGV